MENKSSNKSITRLIYSLMAVMLAVIVGISAFTVSSRRRGETEDTSSGTSDTSADADSADTKNSPSSSDSAGTTVNTPDTSKGTDTSSAPDETSSNPTSADTGDVSALKELRYFVMPVVGSVAKEFEIEIPVYSLTMNDYRAHTGVDICAPLGSDVVAASSGTVCKIWNDPLMGCSVTIDHGDNIYTTYMNLSKELDPFITVGADVAMGQALGTVGESALVEVAEEPHLHLEMKVDGKYVDPLDYMGVSSEQDMSYED